VYKTFLIVSFAALLSGILTMQAPLFAADKNPPPIVTSVRPRTGSTDGATKVAILGDNFRAGDTVLIGGVMATNVQVTNSTRITAKTPAHAPGAVDVRVTDPDHQSGTLADGYTYKLGSGIAFAQVNFAAVARTVPSVSAPYTLAQSAHNLNIVVIGWNDATTTISSVTDSSGNSYAPADPVVRGKALSQAMYYAKDIVAAGAGANTVTVEFNQGASYPDLRIFEYAGLDTASPLDVTKGSSGNGFTARSGTVKTNFAKELVFASDTADTRAPGPGYVPIILTHFLDMAEHRIASEKGTFNPTFALYGPTNWVMQAATFKAAGQ